MPIYTHTYTQPHTHTHTHTHTHIHTHLINRYACTNMMGSAKYDHHALPKLKAFLPEVSTVSEMAV